MEARRDRMRFCSWKTELSCVTVLGRLLRIVSGESAAHPLMRLGLRRYTGAAMGWGEGDRAWGEQPVLLLRDMVRRLGRPAAL